MTKPARMIFDLPDDVREALERVRVKLGARSHAETVRKLILAADTSAAPLRYSHPVTVQTPKQTHFTPHPKPGAKK